MPIVTFDGKTPRFGDEVFVDPMATVIGAVDLGDRANVWPGAVLRGDVESISLGPGSSFQDNSVAHADAGLPVIIGAECVIGHMVMIHGAVIGARCLIGIGSTLLNGCEIGEESIVGAHALITQGRKFPPRSLIVGSPARVVRELTDAELAPQREFTERYIRRALAYLEQGLGIDLGPFRVAGGEGGHEDAAASPDTADTPASGTARRSAAGRRSAGRGADRGTGTGTTSVRRRARKS